MRSPEQTAADFYRLDRDLGELEPLRQAFVDAQSRLATIFRQRDAEHEAARPSGWISVQTALPESFKVVAVAHDGERWSAEAFWFPGDKCWIHESNGGGVSTLRPTHWMPLPSPPPPVPGTGGPQDG